MVGNTGLLQVHAHCPPRFFSHAATATSHSSVVQVFVHVSPPNPLSVKHRHSPVSGRHIPCPEQSFGHPVIGNAASSSALATPPPWSLPLKSMRTPVAAVVAAPEASASNRDEPKALETERDDVALPADGAACIIIPELSSSNVISGGGEVGRWSPILGSSAAAPVSCLRRSRARRSGTCTSLELPC
jgi:hypothetical protein